MNENQAVEEIKPELVWLDLNKEEMQAYLKDKYTTSGTYINSRHNKMDIDPAEWVRISNKYDFTYRILTDDLFQYNDDQSDDGFTVRPTYLRIAKIDGLDYVAVATRSTLVDTYDHFITIHRLLPANETVYYQVIREDVLREVMIEAFKQCLTKDYLEVDPFYRTVSELYTTNAPKEAYITNLAFGPIGYYDYYHPVLNLLQKLLETHAGRYRVSLSKAKDVKTWLDALPVPDELKADWEQYRPDIEKIIVDRMEFYLTYKYDKTKRTYYARRYKCQTQYDKPYPLEQIALLKYRLRQIPTYSMNACFQFKRSELLDEWDMNRDAWTLSIQIGMDIPETLKILYEQKIEKIIKETINIPIVEITAIDTKLDSYMDEIPF